MSLCAGDGRDLIEVLSSSPHPARVSALLVELDATLAERARHSAAAVGLDQVTVRQADAGDPAQYADAVGADLVLLAGVFGNISDADVRTTIGALPMLCAPGARVIWTRHRNDPDLTGAIRTWFAQEGFRERSFTAPDDARFTVGVHEFTGLPRPVGPSRLPVHVHPMSVGRVEIGRRPRKPGHSAPKHDPKMPSLNR